MIFELFRFLTDRGILPVFLLLLAGFLVAFINGSSHWSLALYMLFSATLQLSFLSFSNVYNLLIGIEELSSKAIVPGDQTFYLPAILLSFTPFLYFLATWLPWALATCVALFYGRYFLALFVRLFNRTSLVASNIAAFQRVSPSVIVHINGDRNTAYQINQWLPVLEQLGLPIAIIIRDRSLFPGIISTTLPIFYIRNLMHLETVYNHGVKTVLYPGNWVQNGQSLRFYKLNHFFINHGESDKAVNQSKLLMAYDKLLVGGPMAERRLLAFGLPVREGQIVHVGRPQAELQLEQRQSVGDIQTVLYAPTWEGFVNSVNYSSVGDMGLSLLRSLAEIGRYKVLFKPHPFTGRRSAAHKQALAEMSDFVRQDPACELIDSMVPIEQCMNRSDAMFADVSSVLNDYLVTRKPMALCVNKLVASLDLEQELPTSRATYLLRDGAKAAALLEKVAQHDELTEQREAVRKDSLGDFGESSLNRFASVIRESIED
ncbi:MAG: CDP-glycerol glycerophosphotransferase family protein [Pseudomonadota bacterium]